MKSLIIAAIFFLALSAAFGQIAGNHPELSWMSLETDHFFVHYHLGTERTARMTADIAESMYGPLTSLYAYEPDTKIHFIIRDHDDESNGAAFYYDNKVEVWAPAMNFHLRGTHHWLCNVVSHELSHMISMGAVRRWTRQVPAVYFQWLDYEKEKRPDVIHGYPRTLVSFPFPGTLIPIWFAEGMAQVQSEGAHHDKWDSHRDMVLRTALWEGKLLTREEMGSFGKSSLGNERVYNQGFGLTLYLVQRYGEEVLYKLVEALRKPWRIGFGQASKAVMGIDEEQLYLEWIEWLREGYGDPEKEWVKGHLLEEEGEGNFYPVPSQDGRFLAYLSSRGRDYMSQMSLWILDLGTGEKRKLAQEVSSSMSWSPDGSRIVYAKNKARDRHGSRFFDLYLADLKTGKETRLTRGTRGREPDWSPDGETLVYVEEKDGTSNLMAVPVSGGETRALTRFGNGEQLFQPRWMNDTTIVFTMSDSLHGRDIWTLDLKTGVRPLVCTPADERDVFPDRVKNRIYYSSDASGIFNVYRMDLDTKETVLLTRVPGGAFMPSACGDTLTYALFTAGGYRIARLESPSPLAEGSFPGPYREIDSRLTSDLTLRGLTLEPRPYRPIYSKISFLPRLMIDFPQKLKIGTYFYGSDFLDRYSVLGGFAVNSLLDTDIFGIFTVRSLLPTLFLELYQQTRHTEEDGTDYRFNLMEADAGADWNLGDDLSLRTAYVFSRYDAGMRFEDQGQTFKFSYTYHIGHALQIQWTHDNVPASIDADIAPRRGRRIFFQAESDWQRFLDGFEVHEDYGTLIETYVDYHYYQLLLDWTEYLASPIRGQSLAFRFRAGWIDRPVDSFYHLFGGGLDGMRGYPYYSIEGRSLVHARLAYRIPFPLGFRLGFLDVEKAALSLYGEIGDAWESEHDSIWKRDLGAQLRIAVTTFSGYPMKFFFDCAYGLDRFENRGQEYGREWRFYMGLLFDFLD